MQLKRPMENQMLSINFSNDTPRLWSIVNKIKNASIRLTEGIFVSTENSILTVELITEKKHFYIFIIMKR